MAKPMTKAREIELLEELSNPNSYFYYAFSEGDIQIMIQNIRNDFFILKGTAVQDKVDLTEETNRERNKLQSRVYELEEMVSKYRDVVADMENAEFENKKVADKYVVALLKINHADADVYSGSLSQSDIVKLKIRNGIELTGGDKIYLEQNLS